MDVASSVVDDKLVIYSGLHQDMNTYNLEEAREMFKEVLDDLCD